MAGIEPLGEEKLLSTRLKRRGFLVVISFSNFSTLEEGGGCLLCLRVF